jgi:hypothetical protein
MRSIVRRVALPIGAAVVLGTGGFAFMASNTVAVSYAGSGGNAIGGYHVTDIHFVTTLNPDHGVIDAVDFNLDHPADPNNLEAIINDINGGAQYYQNCSAISGGGNLYRFECASTTPQNISHLDSAGHLTVRAAQ